MVRYCHFIVCNLGHCVIDHVVKLLALDILEVLFFIMVQFGQCWWLMEF